MAFVKRRYGDFVGRLRSMESLEPRKRIVGWVAKTVDEIYDAREAYEEHQRFLVGDMMEAAGEGEEAAPELEPMPFDRFVLMTLAKKNGLRSLTEQTALDLVYNVELERSDNIHIELFALFLEGTYDAETLEFFLFARACICAEVRPGPHTPLRDVTVTLEHALGIGRVVFRIPVLVAAFDTLLRNYAGDSGARVSIPSMLAILVLLYHKTRPDGALLEYNASTSMAHLGPDPESGVTSALDIISEGLIAALRDAVQAQVSAFFDSLTPAMVDGREAELERLRDDVGRKLNARVAEVLSDLISKSDLASAGMNMKSASRLPRDVIRYHEHMRVLASELRVLEGTNGPSDPHVVAAQGDFADQLILSPDIQAFISSCFSDTLNLVLENVNTRHTTYRSTLADTRKSSSTTNLLGGGEEDQGMVSEWM